MAKIEFLKTFESYLSNISRTRRGGKQAVSVVVDVGTACVALWAAYSLRFGYLFDDFATTWHLFVLISSSAVLVMAALGVYRWVVRSSNRSMFLQLCKACALSAVLLALFTYLLPPDRVTNPRSIFIIFGMLLCGGVISTRLLWQGLFDSGKKGEPIAIYGVSADSAHLVYSLNQGSEFRPVVILDDNPALAGTTVGGVRVHQPSKDTLKDILSFHDIGRVVLAMPSISAAEYEAKVSYLKQLGMLVQTVPTYPELISGAARMDAIRDISINDVLGRSEVPPNPDLLGRTVANAVVMVTGGGGSIGSELCRQIALQKPRKLVVFDHGEENLYRITEELRNSYADYLPTKNCISVLGTVNDASALCELMSKHKVDTIFHAAAYKHVPIVEAQPEQGVRVNIFGTLAVLEAAIKHNVENFVLISTDKAVRPTNAMGATKRVAELILQAKARSGCGTKISMVRFGNVLGSSGSVVPKFKKQIEDGGPITLTHPDITRYFMTIPEAAQLVLQASAIAKGGDVFVLDMGNPVRIEDLAITMVRMSGKRLKRDTGNDSDIDIVIEGLRPGEKMYEEMFISGSHRSTDIKKVYTANEAWMDWDLLKQKLDTLSYMGTPTDRVAVRSLLLRLAYSGQPSTDLPLSPELPTIVGSDEESKGVSVGRNRYLGRAQVSSES